MFKASARKYRPQKFSEVIGQEAIVQTIKNGIQKEKLAHAYLLCGPRGTGKTTLARLIAKAINCPSLNDSCEPCGTCSSCQEITSGASLDVLEIDGASHRGIDDIRAITQGVGFSVSSGKCKVYIIDEVHMLTKEAFNALLKTLEEPPANAKFLLATTEPHKVPITIVSRCQRFHLNSIGIEEIITKLKEIASEEKVEITDDALYHISEMAEGGLRDAESLFDQVVAFSSKKIDMEKINDVFGLMSKKSLFQLDQAGKEGRFEMAFEIVDQLFREGKHLLHFLDMLIDHFRTLSKLSLGLPAEEFINSKEDRKAYQASRALYRKAQILDLLSYLVDAKDKIRNHHHPRVATEVILLHILRSHHTLPIETIIEKLNSLENEPTPPPTPLPEPIAPEPSLKAPPPAPPPAPTKPKPKVKNESVDPTPLPQEFDRPAVLTPQEDTLIQFAAIELEGIIKK